MSRSTIAKASLLALGFAGLAAPALADGPFDACTDRHWALFAAAMQNPDAAGLSAFLDAAGVAECPLGLTAESLLCQIDPAACLIKLEPSAPPPVEDEPEPWLYMSPPPPPGSHIGVENDHPDNDPGGNESPAPSADPGPSTPSEPPSTDKPSAL